METPGSTVLVAGATGAIGRRLVPDLLARGHRVAAMVRRPESAELMRGLGAEPVVADALDRVSVARAVAAAAPDVVVHQLTALANVGDYRNFDREFAATNELRTRGTDNLLAAARAAGVRRVVAQSYGSWTYARTDTGLKTEDDDLDPNPPAKQRQSLAAIRHLEEAVTGAPDMPGIALRYGSFYGPGTSIAPDGTIAEQVMRRKIPIVGSGAGVWSFLHIDDAVGATIVAIEREETGIYNICDDEPAAVADWLPELARVLGAKPPMRVPAWVGRLAAGEVGMSLFTQIRGMANTKAKRVLGWSPAHPSWREGFRRTLGEPEARSISGPRVRP